MWVMVSVHRGSKPPGRRAAGFPGRWGDGEARGRGPVPPEPRALESRRRRKSPVRCGGGPGEKAAMTSLAVYPTSAPASGSGSGAALGGSPLKANRPHWRLVMSESENVEILKGAYAAFSRG